MGKYRSMEERTLDYLKSSVPGFFKTLGQSFYGTFASGLRVPTLVRKMINGQTMFEKDDDEFTVPEGLGVIGGFCSAIGLEIYGIANLVHETNQSNYAPLIATGVTFLTTNLASLAFEIGRLPRTREENPEFPRLYQRNSYQNSREEKEEILFKKV
ncbi:MAG: hypothetical protein AABX83_04035 [Nanoarchaeota archaeon]